MKRCSVCGKYKLITNFSDKSSKCKPCKIEYSKQKYERNPDKKREYRIKNINKIREREKIYRRENPDKMCIKSARYHARKMALPATFTESQWKHALEYFDYKCAYCGVRLEKAHQEHFIPVSKGGGYTRHNIVPSCKRCNFSKSNKDPFVWLEKKRNGLLAYERVIQYFERRKEDER